MAPFWLEGIRLYNFRSFAAAEIKFSKTGLTLIRGKNLDTGGSSYSGKSTVGLAIAFALGYLPFSAKDQRSWGSDTACAVELDIGTEDGTATIRAGDKPWLKLPDGRKVTSSSAIKEERDRFLGTAPEVLAALTWQRQKRGSRFLSKTDAEKKEFLANVMPWLIKIEEASEVSDVRVKQLADTIALNRQLLSNHEQDLRSLVVSEPVLVDLPVIDELEESVHTEANLHQADLKSALLRLNEAEGMVVEVEGLSELAQASEQAHQRILRLRGDEAGRIREFNGQAGQLERTISNTLSQVSAIAPLRQEIAALGANKCPTCTQAWLQAADRLKWCEGKLEKALEEESRLPGLLLEKERMVFVADPRIQAMESAWIGIEGQLKKLKEDRATRLNLQQAVRNQALRDQQTAERRLTELDRDITEAEHNIELARKENEHRLADYQKSKAKQAEVLVRRDAKLAEIAGLEEELRAEEDFRALIGRGGFLGSIFEEVLREITEETNKILSAVANTAHVSVQFTSESVTLKGKINKVITPVVSIGGNIADLESGASGGMGTSIGLAVDLAVATVISRRTNTWPGWLILDESFEGLDQVSKEACLEILKQHACNRLVMVVDHAAETKELFSSFIEIEFANGVSRVLV